MDYGLTVCAEEILSRDYGRFPLTLDGQAHAVFRDLANTKASCPVVFDNVEKPEMMLKTDRCFPVAQNASVLITTCRQNV